MECQATMHLESDGESDFEAVQALESWHPFTKENPYVDGPTQMRDGVVSQASHSAGCMAIRSTRNTSRTRRPLFLQKRMRKPKFKCCSTSTGCADLWGPKTLRPYRWP